MATIQKEMTKGDLDKVKMLSIPWEYFCKREFEQWTKTNPPSPIFVWNPRWMFDYEEERDKRWKQHIREIGNLWWLEYGFKLVWPDDPKEPLGVEKI